MKIEIGQVWKAKKSANYRMVISIQGKGGVLLGGLNKHIHALKLREDYELQEDYIKCHH